MHTGIHVDNELVIQNVAHVLVGADVPTWTHENVLLVFDALENALMLVSHVTVAEADVQAVLVSRWKLAVGISPPLGARQECRQVVQRKKIEQCGDHISEISILAQPLRYLFGDAALPWNPKLGHASPINSVENCNAISLGA